MPADAPLPSQRLEHAPPLSIAYIMLATAVTAVVLTVMSQMLGVQARRMVWPVLAVGGVASLIGWMYTATLLLLWHAARRTLWRLEPGEWLLVCLANAVSMVIVVALLQETLGRGGWSGGFAFRRQALNLAELIVPGAMAAVYLLSAAMQRQRWWWSAAMASAAILFLLFNAMYVRGGITPRAYYGLAWWYSIGVIVCLAGGVISDRSNRLSRHWVHWSGVGLTGMVALAFVVVTTLALVFHW